MSPTIVVILMLSSCSLLVMLLFALRKRNKKEPTALSTPTTIELDLSSLTDLKVEKIQATHELDDILSLVNRYRFFQGKNLEQFEKFLRSGDLHMIEQLIGEKFAAQQKPQPEKLAKMMSEKLLTSVEI